MAELEGVGRIAEQALPEYAGEVSFAVGWAREWLVSYDAGHCSLLELLNAAKAGASRVPPPWSRAILGVVAHKATLADPTYLGESRPKTPPAVVMSIGSLVQILLFDESGVRLRTIEEAALEASRRIADRELVDSVPTLDTIIGWHSEWRKREEGDGIPVPRPPSGRPTKK